MSLPLTYKDFVFGLNPQTPTPLKFQFIFIVTPLRISSEPPWGGYGRISWNCTIFSNLSYWDRALKTDKQQKHSDTILNIGTKLSNHKL